MVKLSVVININSKDNLENTLISLCNQSFKDFEVIYIGKNNILKLMRKYQDKFPAKMILKKGSSFFNTGFEESDGEYISFINSGDVFKDKDAFKKINESIGNNNPDMISFDNQNTLIPPNKYKNSIYYNKNIFKSDLKCNVDDLKNRSGNVFLSQMLSQTNKIALINTDFDSMALKTDYKQIDDYFNSYKLVLNNLSNSDFDDVIYQFREDLLDFIDELGIDKLDTIIKSIEVNFKDYPEILRNFKEYLYFKYKDDSKFKNRVQLEKNPQKPRISVLIPVYNAEEYLNESITSLLNQTLDDFELICVNDGSKDNSLDILNEFSKKDSRVKVFDKENGGCGSARNRALDEAKGEYIYFFNPDDLVPANTLEEAYKSAVFNLVDMVIFKANIFDENGISDEEIFFKLYKNLKQKDYERFTFTYKDIDDFVVGGGFAPWSKLYKKEFLDSYDDFRFDTGMAFDDVPFHVKSMIRAKRLAYVNKILYHYRVDNANSVNSTSSNGFDIFKVIDIVKDFLIKEGVFDEFEKRFYIFQINHTLAYIISTNSAEYYNIARDRFLKIEDYNVTKNREKYNLVVENPDYYEFKTKFFEMELNNFQNIYKRLKKENDKLKKENRKLRKENDKLFESRSWKITSPLRKIKK